MGKSDFDEAVFVWSLTVRPEDAKSFALKFDPDWLRNDKFKPILAEVFNFTKTHGMPPSIPALRDVFQDTFPVEYQKRYKGTLDELQNLNPDRSLQLYHIDKASQVAVVRSFQVMQNDHDFNLKQTNNEGHLVLADVQRWLQQHGKGAQDITKNIDEAVIDLMTEVQFSQRQGVIPIGIDVIDDWCGGGLRQGQLGLFLAPTGHGKSAVLSNIARKVAFRETLPTWMVTNELTWQETTERLMSGLLNIPLNQIMRDPLTVRKEWDTNWKKQLGSILWITDMNREVCTNEIEAEMMRQVNIYGRKPILICLDFLERMRPNEIAGFNREATWNWIGAIAQDLVRMAKRQRVLIWSACQTNRAGLTSETLSLEMTQGSIRQLQEAAAVIGMSKVTEDDNKVTMKFTPLKMRQSKGGSKSKWVQADLSKMQISNIEDKEAEAREYERRIQRIETNAEARRRN